MQMAKDLVIELVFESKVMGIYHNRAILSRYKDVELCQSWHE